MLWPETPSDESMEPPDSQSSSSALRGEASPTELSSGKGKQDGNANVSGDLPPSAPPDCVGRSQESPSSSNEGGGGTRTRDRRKNSALLAMPLDEIARTLRGKFTRSESVALVDSGKKPLSKQALLTMSLDAAASLLRERDVEKPRSDGSTRSGQESGETRGHASEGRRRLVQPVMSETKEEDVERKLDMALEDIIENEKGNLRPPVYHEVSTRRRSVFRSRFKERLAHSKEHEAESSSSLPAAACDADPEQRVNDLLDMSLDAAAHVLRGNAREDRTGRRRRPRGNANAEGFPEGEGGADSAYGTYQRGSRGVRQRRGRLVETEESTGANRQAEYSDEFLPGVYEEAEEGEDEEERDIEDEEAESDDEEVDRWLRAFRRAVMMPLGVGTRGWKYLGEVGQEDTVRSSSSLTLLAPAHPAAFSFALLLSPFVVVEPIFSRRALFSCVGFSGRRPGASRPDLKKTGMQLCGAFLSVQSV